MHLQGWCHEKGELLLVYDYMPNGSLDRLLFGTQDHVLPWENRYHIVSGVAEGLAYLHGEWEKQVVHRDVKASNVLLDFNFNPRLGDFGLARLIDHNKDPKSSRIAGTWERPRIYNSIMFLCPPLIYGCLVEFTLNCTQMTVL